MSYQAVFIGDVYTVAPGGTIRLSAQNVTLEPEKNRPNPLLKDGKYVKISIEDHGTGISEEDLLKLFDPYFSTKEKGTQRGMGLGLSIAYSIVEKHEGYINVESEMGNGTTVSIYLPAFEKEIPEVKPDHIKLMN